MSKSVLHINSYYNNYARSQIVLFETDTVHLVRKPLWIPDIFLSLPCTPYIQRNFNGYDNERHWNLNKFDIIIAIQDSGVIIVNVLILTLLRIIIVLIYVAADDIIILYNILLRDYRRNIMIYGIRVICEYFIVPFILRIPIRMRYTRIRI